METESTGRKVRRGSHTYPCNHHHFYHHHHQSERKGEERSASTSQTMTQHAKNESKKTRLLRVTPRALETSLVKSSHPVLNPLPLLCHLNRTPSSAHTNPHYVWGTATQQQLPPLLLSLQPRKPQPTSTRPNTLIIHGSRKGIHKDKSIPYRMKVSERFVWAHHCAEAKAFQI